MSAADLGITRAHLTMADLGRATRLVLETDQTTLVAGAGRAQGIEGRVQQLRPQSAVTTADDDREQRPERVATLVGGVALMHVGAATATARQEKKAGVEDARHAPRAAVAAGVIPGGGVALGRGLPALERLPLPGDEAVGAWLVKRALEEPRRPLATHAGAEGARVGHTVQAGTGA